MARTMHDPPTADEVRAMRGMLDLTQDEFAAALGMSSGVTVYRWESDRATPPRMLWLAAWALLNGVTLDSAVWGRKPEEDA